MKKRKAPRPPEARPSAGLPLSARLVEACWLAAVAVVPLANDPHNVAGFQSFKISLIRTLGLIVAGAMVMRWLDRSRRPAGARFDASSWGPPLAAVLGTTLLASLFSLEPASSFLGSPEFVEGFFTLLCAAALFVGVATTLRTRIQFERLVSVALAASVPVCLYALLQWARMDPTFASDGSDFEPGRPAGSLAGHPIQLAGSLLMLIPLTLWRIWAAVGENCRSGRRRVSPWVIVHLLLLVLQVAAFVSAEKRGPFVALVVAAFCACVLVGALQQRFRLVIAAAGVVVLIIVALTALALTVRPASPAEKIPVVRALARIIPVDSGGADPYRKAVWSQGPKIASSTEPFVFPDGTSDRWSLLRPFVGYGPETISGVLTKQWLFVANGPGGRVESRFHSHFWDLWVTTGLVGLAAMVWFYLRLLRWGLAGSGLSQPRLLEGQAVLSAGAMGGASGAIWGWGFAGIGFQLGLVLGVVGAIFLQATRTTERSSPGVTSRSGAALAMTVALIAHWMELGFAFPTATTSVLFWVFGGATVALAAISPHDWTGSAAGPEDHIREREPSKDWVPAGLLGGMMLIVLLHGFVHYATFQAADLWQILSGALTRIQYDRGPSLLLPVVFFPAWLAAVYLLTQAPGGPGKSMAAGKAFLLAAALSASLGCAYAFLKGSWLARIGPIPQEMAFVNLAIEQAARFAWMNIFFMALIAILTLAIAGALSGRFGPRAKASTWRSFAAAMALFVLGGAAFWLLVSPALRRSAYEGWGQVMDSAERYALAAAVYHKGLVADPRHLTTRMECSAAYLNAAQAATIKSVYEEGMREAERVLEQGRKYGEFHFINYYLGRIRMLMAIRSQDKGTRDQWAAKAEEAYRRALVFAPQNETALAELAILAEFVGDREKSRAYLGKAASVTAPLNPIPWAEFYSNQSFSALDAVLKTGYARHAVSLFERAELLATTGKRNEFETRDLYRRLMIEGTLRRTLHQPGKAGACFQKATELLPPEESWQANAMLAQTYLDLGDKRKALPLIEKALRSAPSEAIDSLNSLRAAASQ